MNYQYFAVERNKENFNDKNLAVKDYLVEGDKVLTPFSGRFPSYERATKYMDEHGLFWMSRGIKLELKETEREKDY